MAELDIDVVRPIVLSDTPEGFELFYTLVWNRPLPKHGKKWIEQIYKSHKAGRGTIIYAFVTSTKTTIITDTFLAYRILLEPEKRNLVVQASDKNAWDNTQEVAVMISTNPAVKALFPNIEPDLARGWSNLGYEVKRNDMDYGEFRRYVAKDPCWQGVGYGCQGLPGKHPDGCLILDDLNTEENTRSDRERQYVNDVLLKTIMSRVIPGTTWIIAVGTPWCKGDGLTTLEGTGLFDAVWTPICDENGVPVWPEERGLEKIEFFKKILGPIGYAVMCMLDLSKAEGLYLKKEWLHQFPHDKIEASWPVVMGVDYASNNDPLATGKRDFFAISVGREIPGGGLVLVDGFYGQVSTVQAEMELNKMALFYPGYKRIRCETLGKGEEFYWGLNRSSALKTYPAGVDNKSKEYRYTKILAPLVESSRLYISDAPNPFLMEFTREWLGWLPKGKEADDCLDATYHMVMASDNLPMGCLTPDDAIRQTRKRSKQPSPWASFAEI